jgi:hypothetical protein
MDTTVLAASGTQILLPLTLKCTCMCTSVAGKACKLLNISQNKKKKKTKKTMIMQHTVNAISTELYFHDPTA